MNWLDKMVVVMMVWWSHWVGQMWALNVVRDVNCSSVSGSVRSWSLDGHWLSLNCVMVENWVSSWVVDNHWSCLMSIDRDSGLDWLSEL